MYIFLKIGDIEHLFHISVGHLNFFFGEVGFPGGSEVKESACNAEDPGLIPGLGRSPGEGNGNPLQYPCLENPMEGGAWWAIVHGVAKSQTGLNYFTFTFWRSVCIGLLLTHLPCR